MRRHHSAIRLLQRTILAVSLIVPAMALAQDSPPAGKKGGDKAAPKDVGKQWAEQLARREKLIKALEDLEERFQTSDIEGKKKIQSEYVKLRADFSELEPAMTKIAPLVFEKDPTDAVAAQFVIGKALKAQQYQDAVAVLNGLIKSGTAKPNMIEQIIGILLEENRFADVIQVADKLVEAKDVNPRLLVIDSMAHFNANDFEKARELSKRAAKASPDSAGGAEGFARRCDEVAALWKKELEIRAREAKTDDLPRVLFTTNKGDIVLELFENEAPNTVANFISLVEGKKYDGIKVHRVDLNFVAQAGDPNTLDDDPSNDGKGGPGYTIACECYSEKARMHFQGSLSMAHAGKDTGGSQFFLTHCPTPHLNWAPGKTQNNHTVFGRIIEGLDVALALRIGDVIESAKVIRKRDHAYVPVKSGRGKK